MRQGAGGVAVKKFVLGAVIGVALATAEKARGGLGILVGDGMLPHPGLEQMIETYYSYAISSSTKVTFDYQFIANPAYNRDRGPVNVFAGRFYAPF
jgi:hypothetical protein